MQGHTHPALVEFVEQVKTSDDFDQIVVPDEGPQDDYVDLEWDGRCDSAMQMTKLQEKVNSTVPVFNQIEVHHADITTQTVRFTVSEE